MKSLLFIFCRLLTPLRRKTRGVGPLSIVVALVFLAAPLASPAQETNAPVLTLVDAQKLALANHPRVIASRFQVSAAGQAVKEARSAEFPTVNLYGTAAGANDRDTRILAGGLNNPSVYDRVAGGLGVSQLITDFGRTANLTASSRYQERAENENAADVREKVWLQVSSSYYGVLNAQAVLQVAGQTVTNRQLMLEQVNTLATNKLKSALDVSFSQVLLEQGQLLVERAENGLAAAQASFTDALGLRDQRQFQLVEPPSSATSTNEDVEDLIQTALARRPELLSLRAQIESAHRFARAERDARLPTVSALGVIGNSPIHDERAQDNYAAADLNISLPLFAGGLYLARQHRAEEQASAVDEQLRGAEDDVIQQVRVAWLNVHTARQVLQTSQELARNASEAFELAQARYQAGLSSVVELSEAQLNQVSAKISEANAHYELLQDEAQLDYQTGVSH
jgi:outer membrane protein